MNDFLFDESAFSTLDVGRSDDVSVVGDLACQQCGLHKTCLSPGIPVSGEGRRDVFVVGEAPGEQEDRSGENFVGWTGRKLADDFKTSTGMDLRRDCRISNVLQCRPPNNKYDGSKARFCLPRLRQQIKEHKPKVILCLGAAAISNVLRPPKRANKGMAPGNCRGLVFPSLEFNCWVVTTWHPSYVSRMNKNHEIQKCFERDLRLVSEYLKKPFNAKAFRPPKTIWVDDPETAFDNWKRLKADVAECLKSGRPFAFDYETNKISPFDSDSEVYWISLSFNPSLGYAFQWVPNDPKKVGLANALLSSENLKVAQNATFEELWSRRVLGLEVREPVYCTQLASHILQPRGEVTGLAFQTFWRWGTKYKDSVDVKKIGQEDLAVAAKYAGLDAAYELKLFYSQCKAFRGKDGLVRGNKFFQQARRMLMEFKDRGLLLDHKRVEHLRKDFEKRVANIDAKLGKCSMELLSRTGDLTDFYSSPTQISKALKPYIEKHNAQQAEDAGLKISSDEKVLEALAGSTEDVYLKGFCLNLLERRKIQQKGLDTFLIPLPKMLGEDGKIHADIRLDIAETMRSSSANPNLQNLPVRDKLLSRVRWCLVAPPGKWLLHADVQGAEVCGLCNCSHDQRLKKFILEGFDFHRYWAARLYGVPEREVTSQQRQEAKNGFVFPSFYGAQPPSIAKRFNKSEAFIRKLQEGLWKMFPQARAWQKQRIKAYRQEGFLEQPFGFRQYAPLSTNQVINTPIQGSSFHLILWGMLQAEKEMRRRRLKSILFSEVHDDLWAVVEPEELDEVVEVLRDTIEREWFPWQEVPMRLDFDVGYDFCELTPLENWREVPE